MDDRLIGGELLITKSDVIEGSFLNTEGGGQYKGVRDEGACAEPGRTLAHCFAIILCIFII